MAGTTDADDIRRALIQAGEAGISIKELATICPDCSPANASTCLTNLMEAGFATRKGKRKDYRYFHTGQEFVKPSKKGQRCQPTDSYERICATISGFFGEWFTAGEIAAKLGIETSVVCNLLHRLTVRDHALERRDKKGWRYEYRQIDCLPVLRFPKGEIPDLFFAILKEANQPITVGNAALLVEKLRTEQGRNGHFDHLRYYEVVRKIADRWKRCGYLVVTHDSFDRTPYYALREGVEERPLCLAI